MVSGIGVGVFRVHPLIMTLGMSFVVLGLSNVWQLQMVQTGSGVPDQLRWIGSSTLAQVVPYSLLVFVPLTFLILLGLRRTGYGRLLYAIGDNPIAARLAGTRSWQVLIVLYVISAVMAGIAGLLHVFDPEVVILGGQVVDAGAELIIPLQEEVWARSRGLLGREVPLLEQQVADKSGIVGAAGLVMAPRG